MKTDRSSFTEEEKPAAGQPSRGTGNQSLVFALISAVFSEIAVFGLFFGYFLENAPLGRLLAGGEPILRGALFGVILEVFRGSIAPPAGGTGLLAGLPYFLYAMIFVLAIAVVLSLAFTVGAFLKPSASRKLCYLNAHLVLLCYGALSFGALLWGALTAENFSWQLFDLPTLITSAALLLLLFFLGALARKGRSATNLFLLLVTLTGCLAYALPGTKLLSDLTAAFAGGLPSSLAASLLILFALLLFNLAFSAARLGSGGSLLPDIARFSVWLLAVLLFVALSLSAGTTAEELFLKEPLPIVFLLVPPLAGLLIAAFSASLAAEKKGQHNAERTGAKNRCPR